MAPDLETFIRTHQDQLLAVLVLRLSSRGEAEEVAQEALLRLIQRWDDVRRYESPVGWLHRVASNLATSRWRRARTAMRLRPRMAEVAVHVDADIAEVEALRTELGALPTRQREALLLRHVAGLTPEEVAGVMGATPQAVRSLTHRGAAAVRERLMGDV